MKKIILPIVTLALSINLLAQTNIPLDFIDIGGVRARVYADGQLFQDLANGFPSYEVPRNSGNHAIYASAFWMSSVSTRNNFPHLSVGYEKFGNGNFFKVGPVDIINQIGDTTPQFQRLWKIDKSDIDNHIQNWNNASYVTHNSILDWPGNGNQNTAKILAPFRDLDNDSIYEPNDGEYPLIKGDQAIYTISNSYHNIYGDSLADVKLDSSGMPVRDSSGNFVLEAYSSFSPMKIETHMMVYAYATNNVNVNNSVFVNIKMYHRSNSAIDDHQDFKLSVFSDFDLGNSSDDYVGTDTNTNMFYAYNGDAFDEGVRGMPGYGSNLPAIGVKYLDYNLNHSVYYNNRTGNNGDPGRLEDYANYQRNIWKNGRPMYYSGDGFFGCIDTNTTTKYMFVGDPTLTTDTSQWTEVNPCVVGSSSNQSNFPGDRRMVGGPDLPAQFNHGTSIEFNYAYVFAQSTTSNVDAVGELKIAADSVQRFFDRNKSVGLDKVAIQNIAFNIYPNPTSENTIQISIDESQFDLTIYNIQGKLVQQQSNSKTVDISNLNAGIYFIQIKTANKLGVEKLIITD